jgi:hypothetical protein
MEDYKNKLLNYQETPPADIWNKISNELNDEKVIQIPGLRRKSKLLFYSLTAAASLVIIFLSTVLFNKNEEDKSIAKAPANIEQTATTNKDSIELNQQMLEKIIETPDKKLLASNFRNPKKYITIAGPEGEPVKISAKAATLIVSADNDYPPKPVWNKKIDKWKKIMLSNTTTPTATNLVDILQSAATSDKVE